MYDVEFDPVQNTISWYVLNRMTATGELSVNYFETNK